MPQKRLEARFNEHGDLIAIVDPDTGKDISASAPPEIRPQTTGLVSSPNAHRERLIEDAVRTRRIAASDRLRYRTMFDRDPVGTQQLLASLAPEARKPRSGRGTGLLPELEQD